MQRRWSGFGSIVVIVACLAAGCNSRERTASTAEQERREARLERGRYLVEGLMHCFACHSEVDWKAPEAPPLEGKKGGGAIFPDEGIPVKLVSPQHFTRS